jgi:hypothetical protein
MDGPILNSITFLVSGCFKVVADKSDVNLYFFQSKVVMDDLVHLLQSIFFGNE